MSRHGRGLIYGFLAGVSLSLGGLIVRLLSDQTTIWQFLSWRSYAFAILMFSIAIWQAGSLRALGRETRTVGLMTIPIALVVGLGQICYILGLQNTLVANVTFIVGSAPIFAAFAAWAILGERLTLRGGLALVSATAGIAIMFGTGIGGGHLAGNLFAVGALAAYVAYVILLRISRQANTFVASGFGGLIGLAVAAGMAGGALTIPPADLLLALCSGTFQVGAGFALATMATRLIPTAEVTLLIMIEAVLGPILVWVVVSETIPLATLIGGAVILISVAAYAGFALADDRRRFRTLQYARSRAAGERRLP